jgi:hypothetical protein
MVFATTIRLSTVLLCTSYFTPICGQGTHSVESSSSVSLISRGLVMALIEIREELRRIGP